MSLLVDQYEEAFRGQPEAVAGVEEEGDSAGDDDSTGDDNSSP